MSDPRDKQPAAEAPRHDPWDITIEQNLIGKLLADNRLIDTAAADLEPRQFYDPLHGRLYAMVIALQADGDSVTPAVLHSVMKSDAGMIEVGGQAYLEAMRAAAPASTGVREYVRILLDHAMRRDLVQIAAALDANAHAPPGETTARQAADAATEALLQAGRASARPNQTPFESAMETARQIEAIKQGKPIPGVKTGIKKLDKEIGCLRGGDFITFLGKSGMGKSALMGTIALNVARQGHPVLFFSLEMTASQLVQRMVCDLDFDGAAKPMWYSRIRNGRLTDEEFERFMLSSQKLQGLPLEICDEDGLTISQIASRARAFKAKHGKNEDGSEKTGLILIDYQQIIDPIDERDNRERQIAKNARGCKSLAKRLNWPVGAGSQMNESDEGRAATERRPRASDARESKAIMNESDLMLAPYRPVVAVENRKPLEARMGDPAHIAWQAEVKEVRHRFDLLGLKNRHGRRFDLELWADMGASAIRDCDPAKAKVEEAAEDAGADLLEGIG